jgi:putative Mg2+ transporter-C (MgtC) family protein
LVLRSSRHHYRPRYVHYAAIVMGGVLLANTALRPLAYHLYPAQESGAEQDVTYSFEVICNPDNEAHIRALLLQAMTHGGPTLTALRSGDIEGTARMKVTAEIKGLGRQDEALEQLVVRLSLEGGVSSVSWAVHPNLLE